MNKRIAFVDDEQPMHKMIRSILAEPDSQAHGDLFSPEGPAEAVSEPVLDYDIDHFLDPVKAREAIREAFEKKSPYALLITDIRMPTRSGDWLVAQARNIDQCIRIIVLTSYSDATMEELTQSAGNRNFLYLNKTAPPQVIKQAVASELASWDEDHDDHRAWKRINFNREVRLSSPAGIVAKGVNIGAGGICLMDPSLTLKVDTPLEIEIVGGRIATRGVVRWVEPVADTQYVGVQFIEEDEALMKLIQPPPQDSSAAESRVSVSDEME